MLGEEEISWAPLQLLRGNHVRSRANGRSGVICRSTDCPIGMVKVCFDDDCSTMLHPERHLIKMAFEVGDKVHHGGRNGEVTVAPDPSGTLEVRFGDDGSSLLIQEDQVSWAPCFSKYTLPPRNFESHGTETKILYHLTAQGEDIRKNGEMLRGQKGAVGGAIYFAATERECVRKAKSRGWIVKARVLTGKRKVIHYERGMDLPDLTFRSLRSAKYDSVELRGFNSGTEYVVYSKEQVEILAVYPDRRVSPEDS